jgi:HK97 family phage major capsid protein
MAYNNLTSRTDAQALIPEEVSSEMLGKATEQSAVLQLFRRVPVQSGQVRFPVLSALPMAYWVTGDTGLKQTTEVNWTNKYLNIEEIATIMPVPDNVLADVDANIWDTAMPLLVEAFGRVLDTAVFFGTNAPASFPTNILTAATAAGNSVNEGTSTTAQGGFFGDIDKLYGTVEEDGFDITGFVAATSAKAKLRAARDTQGRKLDDGRVSGSLDSIDGFPVMYPMRGLFPVAGGAGVDGVRLFAGDWNQFIVGVRQDITMKVLDQAVITDNTGAIIYNLPQQDMTAIRLTFRVGWQVANTLNNDRPTEASRYPVGVLKTVGA